jgi:hypothetical protein
MHGNEASFGHCVLRVDVASCFPLDLRILNLPAFLCAGTSRCRNALQRSSPSALTRLSRADSRQGHCRSRWAAQPNSRWPNGIFPAVHRYAPRIFSALLLEEKGIP